MFRLFLFLVVVIPVLDAELCGCKSMRLCYVEMLNTLRDVDEESCIEDVAPGMNTLIIYLKALKQFCSEIVTVRDKYKTWEGRPLYEVELNQKIKSSEEQNKPIILIEAGQHAGSDATNVVLVLIQQLVACNEFSEMTTNVKWIFLPCVNPDGMEYSIYNRIWWKKNLKPSEDKLAYGVDLTRNFGFAWNSCPKITSAFSVNFPGVAPFSENETIFVRETILKYKDKARAYVSVRVNGHSLLYPFSYAKQNLENELPIKRFALEIVNKVNQRAGLLQIFNNESIISYNGRPRCGSSVDYAYDIGIPYSYEMRVFLGRNSDVMVQFQTFPLNYQTQLLMGYVGGLKKLYDLIIAEKDFLLQGMPPLF